MNYIPINVFTSSKNQNVRKILQVYNIMVKLLEKALIYITKKEKKKEEKVYTNVTLFKTS